MKSKKDPQKFVLQNNGLPYSENINQTVHFH